MSLSSEEEDGSWVLDFFANTPAIRRFATSSPEVQLRWFLRFAQTPLPEREEQRRQFEEQGVILYSFLMGPGVFLWSLDDNNQQESRFLPRSMGPPPPPENERPQWIQTLQCRAREFLHRVFVQLLGKKKEAKMTQARFEKLYRGLPAVEYPGSRRLSAVKEGKLVHLYESRDNISPFLLTLGDLLAEVDLSKLKLCKSCGALFYGGKRQTPPLGYCSQECRRKAYPATGRVQEYRKRRAKWQEAKKALGLICADMDAIARKQKLRSHGQSGKFWRRVHKPWRQRRPLLQRCSLTRRVRSTKGENRSSPAPAR